MTTANGNFKKTSATAWHGPQGALALGPVDWEQVKMLLFTLAVPCFLLLFFTTFSFDKLVIAFGSLIFISRLATLRGTPKLVRDATMHWSGLFAVSSVGLLVLSYLLDGSSISGISTFAVFVYAGGVGFYFTAKRLLTWEPAKTTLPAVADVTLGTLKAMREELTFAIDSLSSLKVFDKNDASLVAAWQNRDVATVAEKLAAADTLTQESWQHATGILNRAIACIDAGRSKLKLLLPQVEVVLKPFNIDYSTIPVDRSNMAYGYTSFAIPKKLDFKHIDRQLLTFMDPNSRIAARLTEGSEPLRIAWKLWTTVNANPVRHLYKSKWMRQLKDVEGELSVKAQAVRGDCQLAVVSLGTRILPQMDRMIEVIDTLERGTGELKIGTTDAVAGRDKALKLAFAFMQGKKLLETKAGD